MKKSTRKVFLISCALLMVSSSQAESRKALTINSTGVGDNTNTYGERATAAAYALNSNLLFPGTNNVDQSINTGGILKFSMKWPTTFLGTSMGFGVGGGLGPSVVTKLEDGLGNNAYEETIGATFAVVSFEIEKRKQLGKHWFASLVGSAGYFKGHAKREVDITRGAFLTQPTFPGNEKKEWDGVTASIMPTIGLGTGQKEMRLGVGWSYLSDMPSFVHGPALDSQSWGATWALLW